MSDEEEHKATDPTTSAEELRLLAKRGQRVAAQVASNPNAPLDLLPRLAVLHPARVVSNPAVALYLLEPSVLLSNLTLASCSALVECEETPPFLIALLATSRDTAIRTLAARAPRCPGEVLAGLCADIDDGVREHAARNASTPPEATLPFREAGADKHLRMTGKHQALPAAKVRELASLGAWGEVLAAYNPGCPVDLLKTLASTAHAWRAVLGNPITPSVIVNDTMLDWMTQLTPVQLRDARITQDTWRKLAAQHGDMPIYAVELLAHASLDPELANKLTSKHLDREEVARTALQGRWATRELLTAIASAHPRLAAGAQAALQRSERRSH